MPGTMTPTAPSLPLPAQSSWAAPPVAWFAAPMGLASLGLGWRFAATLLHVSALYGEALGAAAIPLFLGLVVLYGGKLMRARQRVMSEFNDPIISSYFATITISLSLIAALIIPYQRTLAVAVWVLAAAGSLALFITLFVRWVSHSREISHITPAWFLPIVGNAVAVYAAVPLGFAEAGWFLFAVAALFWITVQPLVVYRLVFNEPLPTRLMPSLAVFISSPAVLANAWFSLNGSVADPLFRMFAATALFFALIVLGLTKFTRVVVFSPAWWGYVFPAAALAGCYLRYAAGTGTTFGFVTAQIILGAASAITAYVAVRTVGAGFARPAR